MRSILLSLLPTVALFGIYGHLTTQPGLAQKAATSQSVKVGYFNLNPVRMADPQAVGSEQLKNQAEAQLKNDVDQGNKKIQKMKDEKKSDDEIKKTVDQLQVEINAKMQALAQLVQSNNTAAQERLRMIVNEVAKEKGLDIVVDGAGVFAGGQKVLDNGIDVTDDIVKKLAVTSAAKTSSK